MNLCQLATLKTRMDIETSNTKWDTLLNWYISVISKKVEDWCCRKFELTSRTEYFTVEPGDTFFSLIAYPVTVLTSVHNDADWDFESTDAVSTDNRRLDSDKGLLFIDSYVLLNGFHALKVVYTGGIGATAASVETNYPDLSDAVMRQIIYLYETKNSVGVASANTQTGAVTWSGDVSLLDGVKADLQKYKRRWPQGGGAAL